MTVGRKFTSKYTRTTPVISVPEPMFEGVTVEIISLEFLTRIRDTRSQWSNRCTKGVSQGLSIPTERILLY